jgi:hypothetical protein
MFEIRYPAWAMLRFGMLDGHAGLSFITFWLRPWPLEGV